MTSASARRTIAGLAAAILSFASAGFGSSQASVPPGFELLKKISVPGRANWTDSGIDVRRGQEFYFEASGTISLQTDNPVAGCGPDGLKMKTLQQPLPEENIGGLLGKVREKIEVSTDKQTGEKIQKEIGQVFFIGRQRTVVMPSDGRLLLGINENVAGDNDGNFEVAIYKKAGSNPLYFGWVLF
jgi:hypothetical protein